MAEPVLIRPLGRENLREEPQLEFSVIKEFIKFKENQSPTPSTPPSLNGGIIVGENLIFRRLLLLDCRPINRGRAGVSNQFPRSVLLINSDGFAKANDDDDHTVFSVQGRFVKDWFWNFDSTPLYWWDKYFGNPKFNVNFKFNINFNTQL